MSIVGIGIIVVLIVDQVVDGSEVGKSTRCRAEAILNISMKLPDSVGHNFGSR